MIYVLEHKHGGRRPLSQQNITAAQMKEIIGKGERQACYDLEMVRVKWNEKICLLYVDQTAHIKNLDFNTVGTNIYRDDPVYRGNHNGFVVLGRAVLIVPPSRVL